MKKLIRVVKAIFRRLYWFILIMLSYFLRVFPVKRNKILFLNYYGKGYGDNSKYICEELLNSDNDLDFIWAVNNLDEALPDRIRKVKYLSVRYFYELCTSKVWVDNCRKPLYVRKRKSQYYIQAWHGDLAIKKIEKDAIPSLYSSYIRGAINDSKMADLFVSGNKWMEMLYRQAFWYSGEIANCGYPRRDILYNIKEVQKAEIRKKLGIRLDTKIVIYAPTFRKPQKLIDLSVYSIDWRNVLEALTNRFGGNWIAIVRLHPNISFFSQELNLPDCVINVTDYPDIQELLSISDVCISDYSSVILEFAVTRRPAFIFATDYQEYKQDRDVYFELEELPFPFAENNKKLIQNIASFDSEQYLILQKEFFDKRIGMYTGTHASESLAKIILNKCK